jgi:hypothetical protein
MYLNTSLSTIMHIWPWPCHRSGNVRNDEQRYMKQIVYTRSIYPPPFGRRLAFIVDKAYLLCGRSGS